MGCIFSSILILKSKCWSCWWKRNILFKQRWNKNQGLINPLARRPGLQHLDLGQPRLVTKNARRTNKKFLAFLKLKGENPLITFLSYPIRFNYVIRDSQNLNWFCTSFKIEQITRGGSRTFNIDLSVQGVLYIAYATREIYNVTWLYQ